MARVKKAEAIIEFLGVDGVKAVQENIKRRTREITEQTEDAAEQAKGLKEQWQGVSGFTAKAMAKYGAAAAAMAGAWAVAGRGAKLAAQAGQFDRVFDDGTSALNRFRQATDGVVDDARIQEFAVLARRQGHSINAISSMMRISSDIALATGRDFDQVADSIRRYLSTGEKGGLEDVGLSSLGENTELAQRLAKSMGVTVENLSQASLEAARLNNVLTQTDKAFGDMGKTAAAKMQQVEVKFKNMADQTAIAAKTAVVRGIEGVAEIWSAVDEGRIPFMSQQYSVIAAMQAGIHAAEMQHIEELENRKNEAAQFEIQRAAAAKKTMLDYYETMHKQIQLGGFGTGGRVSVVQRMPEMQTGYGQREMQFNSEITRSQFVLKSVLERLREVEKARADLADTTKILTDDERTLAKSRASEFKKPLQDLAKYMLNAKDALEELELAHTDSAARDFLQTKSLDLLSEAQSRFAEEAQKRVEQERVAAFSSEQLTLAMARQYAAVNDLAGAARVLKRVWADLDDTQRNSIAIDVAGSEAEGFKSTLDKPRRRRGGRRRDQRAELLKEINDIAGGWSQLGEVARDSAGRFNLQELRELLSDLRSEQTLSQILTDFRSAMTDAESAQLQKNAEDLDAFIERWNAAGQMMQGQNAALASQAFESSGALLGQAYSLNSLGESFVTLNDVMNEQIPTFISNMEMFREAGDPAPAVSALKQSAPQFISSLGKITAGFFREKGAIASVMSIFEFAAGIADMASGQYKSGSMHLLSSAMYAAAAAKMGKGGGARRSAPGAGGAGSPRGFTPEKTERQPLQMTVNLSGPVFADEPEVFQRLDNGIRQHVAPWLGQSSEAAIP